MSARTMELEVEDASFMLDTLGKDCEPLQFLRELTENGIQAVQATANALGEVIWDADWTSFDAEGLLKLCCIDTGIGMSGEELKRYINHLSASRHIQSLQGNFGIGAKVAAAPRNPHGLVYVSWKDGQGSMIQLWRDPKTRRWGLKQFEVEPGVFDYCLPLDEAVKPDAFGPRDHGTMVVLLGDHAEANTMEPPAGLENRSKWIAQYLNQRYFRFPEGMIVKAREGWDSPRSDTGTNKLRQVRGQGHYLDRHSVSSGQVQLSGARALWWILDEKHSTRKKDSAWASTGHRAALFQNELYELVTPNRGGYQKVQEFGVRFAYPRVVIYVEPAADGAVTASTTRSELKLGGEPLPWAAWAEEFAGKLPEEICALEEQIAAGSTSDDHQKSIRKRLAPIMELFKRQRYRPTPTGRDRISPPDLGGEAARQESEQHESETPGGGKGGRDGNIYSLFTARHGSRGEQVKTDPWPDIDWVSINHEPPTRTPPHLEDCAARYDAHGNRLEINEDFRVFQDTMRRWQQRYAAIPGSNAVIEDRVRDWYGQVLVETVLGAQALRGSKHWDDKRLAQLLSEEALTAAVQPRYFIEMRLKQELAQALGHLRAIA